MTLRVNTNIPAINSHRNLILNNTNQARTMERLSSGLKINRGADGPASLVISERLRLRLLDWNKRLITLRQGLHWCKQLKAHLTK